MYLWLYKNKISRSSAVLGDRADYKLFGRLDGYGLRRTSGNFQSWDATIQANVLYDLEVTISENSHRCRALWLLFDDTSSIGQNFLRKLDQVVRNKMGSEGIPFHDWGTHCGVLVDSKGLWNGMKATLSSMVA